MAVMYPEKVEEFTDKNEKIAYEILNSLPDSYDVVYEANIGTVRKYTPDFILLSKEYGLVVLDVKFVNLENIERSDSRTIYKKNLERIKNFNEIVKSYTYEVNNYLVKSLKNNSSIVQNRKLNFSYSFGLILFIKNYENYNKQDIAKILSLDENCFIICNDIEKSKKDIENFIKTLNKPFIKGITDLMKSDIINELYINSNASESELINKLSKFNVLINKIKDIKDEQNIFEKSIQLKENLLYLTEYSYKSIEFMNKNLPYALDELIESLKKKKSEIEDEKFKIGVFGYFSSGKSTFLNALLGIDYLPSAEERLTAIFTKIVHIQEEDDSTHGDVKVFFKNFYEIKDLYNETIQNLREALTSEEHLEFYDKFEDLENIKDKIEKKLNGIKTRDFAGEVKDRIKNSKIILKTIIDCDKSLFGIVEQIDIKELKNYVADNKKAILLNEVKIYLENDLLKNIELVDTPGYGSTNSLDTQKAHQFVKEANVVIFLTKATTPIQAMEEKTFFEEYISIYKDSKDSIDKVTPSNLFIVANQIDTTEKSVEDVKKLIIKEIDDEFEGEFIINQDNIFTLSSQYHLDIHLEKEVTKYKNVNEKDLENFSNRFISFLIENKDKEFINQNFFKINEILENTNKSFNEEEKKIISDIKSIDDKLKVFEENKNHIDKKLEMYISSIGNIETKLQKIVKNYLNNLPITITEKNDKDTVRKKTSDNFKSWCKEKELDNNLAYNYFHEYINLITKQSFGMINEEYEKQVKEQLEVVNKELDKYTRELEMEYKIDGLKTHFEITNISANDLKDINLDKHWLRNIFEFFKKIIIDDRWLTYAESMVESWNNNPNVYLKVEAHLNKQISIKFKELDNEFKNTKNVLLKTVENKLNAQKNNLKIRQKDETLFNLKKEKFNDVLGKIDLNKSRIEEQIKKLFGEK